MLEQAMKGDIQLEPFVTHTMGLAQINEDFDFMHEGKSINSLIHFDQLWVERLNKDTTKTSFCLFFLISDLLKTVDKFCLIFDKYIQ